MFKNKNHPKFAHALHCLFKISFSERWPVNFVLDGCFCFSIFLVLFKAISFIFIFKLGRERQGWWGEEEGGGREGGGESNDWKRNRG